MATYTTGNLMIGHYLAGEVSLEGVQADRAAYPRLRLLVNWRLHSLRGEPQSAPQVYGLAGVAGQLWLQESARVIGTVVRVDSAATIWSSDKPSPETTQLVCDLDVARVETIELERNGRVPRFMLDLWPTLLDPEGPMVCGLGRMNFEIPRDEWLRILELMRGWRFEIMEIRYPPTDVKPYERAFALSKKAREFLDTGHFDEAAAASRRVIEALQIHFEVTGRDEENGWKAFFTVPGREKVAVEYGKIFSATKKLAGFAIHELKQLPPNYSRAEAFAIVRIVENLMAVVADLAPTLPAALPSGND